MAQPTTTIITERCQISPPPGSVPPTNLPLTFLDIPWLLCIPMQRLFFFNLPHRFTLSVLPRLKHSLSLALRHFFPLAAVLVCPNPPLKPHLLLSPSASVSLTVAESTADLHRLLSDEPRDATDCHPLVPNLPPASIENSGARASPLLALQVTVFPNSGVAIGATFNHVAADGRAFNHFVKSWAFYCRTGEVLELDSLPSHDRAVILDPSGLEPIFLNHWWAVNSNLNNTGPDPALFVNKVRATFRMGREQIYKLKQSLLAQCKGPEEALSLHASRFVITVAYTWVQLIRAQHEMIRDGDEAYHLSFVADCRNRRGFEYSIPDTYFGNCLAICYVSVKKNELLGENGVLRAAQAIGERVTELDRGALRGSETWMSDWEKISDSGKLVTVAGSPNLRVYDTDFGWGRPIKSQIVQIDVSGAIAFAECKDEEGGMEIGLALHSDEMNSFNAIFERSLKHL